MIYKLVYIHVNKNLNKKEIFNFFIFYRILLITKTKYHKLLFYLFILIYVYRKNKTL